MLPERTKQLSYQKINLRKIVSDFFSAAKITVNISKYLIISLKVKNCSFPFQKKSF